MRISSLALLGVAACSNPVHQTTDTNVLAKVEANAAAAAEDDGHILCARGEAALVRNCTVEQQQEDRGLILTLRQADGGFRRLLVTQDGRGVVAADGAEPATVAVVGADGIEVSIGDDRYRLPATIGGSR